MNPERTRRKNYFVRPAFQSGFAARFALLVALEAVFLAALFRLMTANTLTTAYDGSTLRIERTVSYFWATYLLAILAVAAAVGIAALVVFIFFSHRIGGPIYRIRRDLDTVAAGDLTARTELRRTDELGELAEGLNRLTETMDSRLARMKKGLREASELAESGNAQERSRLSDSLKSLRDIADTFKTSS